MSDLDIERGWDRTKDIIKINVMFSYDEYIKPGLFKKPFQTSIVIGFAYDRIENNRISSNDLIDICDQLVCEELLNEK